MRVLIVEPDGREYSELSKRLEAWGHAPSRAASAASALEALKRSPPELVVASLEGDGSPVRDLLKAARDLERPCPVIVVTGSPRMEDAVLMMKEGARDFWVKPVDTRRLEKALEMLEPPPTPRPSRDAGPPSIITRSSAMERLKGMAVKVAASNAAVFIQGESGTGKELFARTIHFHSPRKDQPFIAVNCAALPENLLESELFGYEKGAFTGATRSKKGKFELAHQGTLLLDEVTEIPVHLQAKLLRVLQENEVDRLGGRYPVAVDVRVVATTNVSLEQALKEGRFRRDLYYRLNVVPLKIPPLRRRRDDIPFLCEHFVNKYNRIHHCGVEGISPSALQALQDHSWPGNVRELENVLQRAMLLSDEPVLQPAHVLFDAEEESPDSDLELMTIGEMEKHLIHKALSTVDGNRTRASEILGISVRTLRNKLKEYRESEEVPPSPFP